MAEETLKVPVSKERQVTAIRTAPNGTAAGWIFVYAPGAGSSIDDPFGTYACGRLASEGFATVRFQFPYMEEGGRRPDWPAVLEATWRAVIEALKVKDLKLAVGGRSMGGRIASQVVAKGTQVDALALFAYPLHPPKKPSEPRDKHFAAISAPTLFCSGTRDAYATPGELLAASSALQNATVRMLDGADHMFGVLKSSDRAREDVWQEATDHTGTWLRAL